MRGTGAWRASKTGRAAAFVVLNEWPATTGDADGRTAVSVDGGESLTNVQRHSESTTAEVTISRSNNNEVVLEVADHGKGLPAAILEKGSQDWMGSQGVGLRGMSERLRQLGGSLDISSDENGTRMRATLPLQKLQSTAEAVA